MNFTEINSTEAMRVTLRIVAAQERLQGFPYTNSEYAQAYRWVSRELAAGRPVETPAACSLSPHCHCAGCLEYFGGSR